MSSDQEKHADDFRALNEYLGMTIGGLLRLGFCEGCVRSAVMAMNELATDDERWSILLRGVELAPAYGHEILEAASKAERSEPS
jgi:hypothetical protein